MNFINVIYISILGVLSVSCVSNKIVNDTHKIDSKFGYSKTFTKIKTFSTIKECSALLPNYSPLANYEITNIDIDFDITNFNSDNIINTSIEKKTSFVSNVINKIDLLLSQAKSYLGTPYRFGGSSRNGIDCSAFVQNSFSVLDIDLPRVSSSQASEGERIPLEEVQKGDLLFFAHNGNRISHVAIVEDINQYGEIFFIHSATSKGVTITSLNDSYWSKRYKKAVRIHM